MMKEIYFSFLFILYTEWLFSRYSLETYDALFILRVRMILGSCVTIPNLREYCVGKLMHGLLYQTASTSCLIISFEIYCLSALQFFYDVSGLITPM